jgi:pyridoxal phosphate enzyme (YggS family)
MDYDVAKNLAKIKENIARSCEKTGANPDDVVIVGVTKYFNYRGIVAAVRDGIKHIGENRPTEIRGKFPAADAALEELLGPGRHYKTHMIGHLQRNKVKIALENFDMIQSLDSIRLAEEIQKVATVRKLEKVECLIELKVSKEDSKTGISPAEAGELIAAVKDLDRIRVLGVMGIPPLSPDPEQTRPYFKQLAETFEKFKEYENESFQMRYLSMGMSHDYHVAVEEGANMVRIGQALFD